MQTTTHIEQRRQAAITSSQEVMSLLNWSLHKYTWHKYLSGLKYLRLYTQDDTYAIEWLETQKGFWQWWKNQWTLREEQILPDLRKMRQRVNREAIYIANHNATTLAAEITPNGTILGDSYAEMMGNLLKIRG